MRAIVNGSLYDTDISELVHRREQRGQFRGNDYEVFTQSLYLSPNGTFFFVYERPESADLYTFDKGSHYKYSRYRILQGAASDDIDIVIQWLEDHDGTEVILERWPERVWAG